MRNRVKNCLKLNGDTNSKQDQQKFNIAKRKLIVNYLRLQNIVKSSPGKCFVKSSVYVTKK